MTGENVITLLEVAAIPPWDASRFLVLSSNSREIDRYEDETLADSIFDGCRFW